MAYTAPTLTGFIAYCQEQGIVAPYTEDTADAFSWAFDWAMAETLICPQMPGNLYTLAVYNNGADRFIRLAQDNGQGTFYKAQRDSFGVFQFKPGVVMASGDEGTSNTLVVPDWYRAIPMGVQEQLKTPWGRMYIAYAQMYGPYVVGAS